ncbi:MAG: GH3 auxin-responsive promoter family protein [Flavobacteriales bacterium]|nr:GH3 auxin-responsive promoter family protein [Flavobacteriales bacterium]
MGLKSIAAKWLAKREMKAVRAWSDHPDRAQERTFRYLCVTLAATDFGHDHGITALTTQEEWTQKVPLRDYEGLKPYIERIKEGEINVLWKGKPAYFCKTSGTTSGTKYIPMSEEGIKAQTRAARQALLAYIAETGKGAFTEGKMIFLQGSPKMTNVQGISVGRLSGIVAHHVPSYLQKNRMPSWKTNSIEDWEKKVDAIVEETVDADMRLISGIPPWVQMYFERLLKRSGKQNIQQLFPNFSVFVHGGVNYQPYKATMEKLIGRRVDSIETYPASEGFIAFQDSQKEEGLLLNLDGGIYYEFVPLTEIHDPSPRRLNLNEVVKGVNYAIVLNTSSGLWGYIIGDTVKFTSTKPYRIAVTGRIKHFISAFGEHVIAEEVEKAMTEVSAALGLKINEFHVAPQVNPTEGLPYHEWFIESEASLPNEIAADLDKRMCALNSYYKDLIHGKVLQPLKVTPLKSGSFNAYMASVGRLGGQNKLPRLSNDRIVAEVLERDKRTT